MTENNMNLSIKSNLAEFDTAVPITPGYVKSILGFTKNYDKQALIDSILEVDTHYTAKLIERSSIFRKAEWTLEPSGNETIDKFVQDELWRILDNNSFQHLHEAIYRRFGILEILWKINGSKVTVDKLIKHHQRSFDYKDGELCIYDKDNDTYTQIPDNKVILCEAPLKIRNQPRSITEQLAMLITIKYYALFKNWPKFNENYSMPPVVGHASSETEKEEMKKALESLGKIASAVISGDSKIDFLELKYSSPETFEKIINICNQEISKAVLAQTLTTQSDGKGSYALGSVQSDVKEDVFTESLDMVCDAINRDLVIPLVNFNFNTDTYPTFKLVLPESIDKKAQRDKSIVELGVKFTKEYFVENYGLNKDWFEVGDPVQDSQKKTLNFDPFI